MPHRAVRTSIVTGGIRTPLQTIAAVMAIVAISLVAPATASQASPVPRGVGPLVAIGSAAMLPPKAHVVGEVARGAHESGAVALRLRDPQGVTRFLDAVSNPRSARFHRYLARGQFAARFGPTSSAVLAVRDALRADGLAVTGVSPNRLLISFSGSASAVEAAFHTGLERVRLMGGEIGQLATAPPYLPLSIARHVEAVVGLDRLTHELAQGASTGGLARSSPHARPDASPGPTACAGAQAQQAFGGITDQQVAGAYGLNPLYASGDTASNQTIDVYELEPFLMSDLRTFEKCYLGRDRTSQVTVTSVDGGAGTGSGGGEAALDVEDVAAIAPGARIHVFNGPNMSGAFGPLDTWNAIAVADDANQVTSSWGICEVALQQGAPGVQQVENEIFEQTAAQGQTVFSAAGDDGSDDCANQSPTPVAPDLSVDDPGSQPYVVSVGGTTMLRATTPPIETVWNDGNDGGAGGGGISETWAMPPWQSSLEVPQTTATQACSNDPSGTADLFHPAGIGTVLPSGTMCREVPDVSAVADQATGITVFWDGQWAAFGGTSSATPLWTAMLAEVNGSSGCAGIAHGVGFAAPLLYQVADTSALGYDQAFNDVTVGNNDALQVGSGADWSAGTGFDLASGLGTPRLTDSTVTTGLSNALCTLARGTASPPPPVVTALSKSSGAVGGGGTTTITGSGFGTNTGSVFFGDVQANVKSWSPASITVTIPAFYAPQGSQSPVAGSADITVVTAGVPRESSAPSMVAVYHYTQNAGGRPVIDYVSEPTGPTAGGGTATIVGSGLAGATAVHFGGVAATIVKHVSADELTVDVPPSDGVCAVAATQGVCAVAVTVTTGSGTSPVGTILPAYTGPVVFADDLAFIPPAGCGCEVVPAPDEYDYAPHPTITSVAPGYASENGTTTVTVTGTGFNLLDFEWANAGAAGPADNQVSTLESISPTQIELQIPSAVATTTQPVHSAFTVLTSGGLSNVSSFAYAGVPKLVHLSRHVAAQANPGTLGVSGLGLADVTSVIFQGQGTWNFFASTSTRITAQTNTSLSVAIPAGFDFAADVLLCSATGCSAPDPSRDTLTITYAGRPVVTSSAPAVGPAHGGTRVTIQGALDSEVTAVDFGTARATVVSQQQLSPSGPIVVVAPPGVAGSRVHITITTVGGTLTTPPQPRSAVTARATFRYTVSTPAAPRQVRASAGVGSASVQWAAPRFDGGFPVTGYVVTATAKGRGAVGERVGATARLAVLTLAAGVRWTVTVRALNRLGTGLPGTTRAVNPRP